MIIDKEYAPAKVERTFVQQAGISWEVYTTQPLKRLKNFIRLDNGRVFAICSENLNDPTYPNNPTCFGLYYTDDGETWTKCSYNFSCSFDTGDILKRITHIYALGNDILARLFDSTTNNYTYYLSQDNGNSWAVVSLPSTSSLTGTIKTNTGRVIITLYSNSEIYYSDDNYNTWQVLTSYTYIKEFNSVKVNGSAASWLYLKNIGRILAVHYNYMQADINKTGIYYSDDDGETWSEATKTGSDTNYLTCGRFFIHDKINNKVYIETGSDSFFVSEDNGETWHIHVHADIGFGDDCVLVFDETSSILYDLKEHGPTKLARYTTDFGLTFHDITDISDSTNNYTNSIGYNTKNASITGNSTIVAYAQGTNVPLCLIVSKTVYNETKLYNKPLTQEGIQALIDECKAYVQGLKNS